MSSNEPPVYAGNTVTNLALILDTDITIEDLVNVRIPYDDAGHYYYAYLLLAQDSSKSFLKIMTKSGKKGILYTVQPPSNYCPLFTKSIKCYLPIHLPTNVIMSYVHPFMFTHIELFRKQYGIKIYRYSSGAFHSLKVGNLNIDFRVDYTCYDIGDCNSSDWEYYLDYITVTVRHTNSTRTYFKSIILNIDGYNVEIKNINDYVGTLTDDKYVYTDYTFNFNGTYTGDSPPSTLRSVTINSNMFEHYKNSDRLTLTCLKGTTYFENEI